MSDLETAARPQNTGQTTRQNTGRSDRVGRFLNATAGLFAFLGGLGLIFAIVVTCLSIVLKVTRRVLDFTLSGIVDAALWSGIKPILGEEELVQYAVGVALFSALPWVMIRRGHVRIDIFEPLFGGGFNRLLNVAADLSLLFVSYMILTRQWYLIFKKARRSQEPMPDMVMSGDWAGALGRLRVQPESQILSMKLWPFYAFAELCVALFMIVALYCTVESLIRLFRPNTPPATGTAMDAEADTDADRVNV